MRKLLLLAVPCVMLLAGCCGDSQCCGSHAYNSSGESNTRTAYRSYDSSETYYTSSRTSTPFNGYPMNPNTTCTTTCPGGNCQNCQILK